MLRTVARIIAFTAVLDDREYRTRAPADHFASRVAVIAEIYVSGQSRHQVYGGVRMTRRLAKKAGPTGNQRYGCSPSCSSEMGDLLVVQFSLTLKRRVMRQQRPMPLTATLRMRAGVMSGLARSDWKLKRV